MENGGVQAGDESRRNQLIEILPSDVATHVSLYLAAYPNYVTLKEYIKKYVKTVLRIHGQGRPVHVFDRQLEENSEFEGSQNCDFEIDEDEIRQ